MTNMFGLLYANRHEQDIIATLRAKGFSADWNGASLEASTSMWRRLTGRPEARIFAMSEHEFYCGEGAYLFNEDEGVSKDPKLNAIAVKINDLTRMREVKVMLPVLQEYALTVEKAQGAAVPVELFSELDWQEAHGYRGVYAKFVPGAVERVATRFLKHTHQPNRWMDFDSKTGSVTTVPLRAVYDNFSPYC